MQLAAVDAAATGTEQCLTQPGFARTHQQRDAKDFAFAQGQ